MGDDNAGGGPRIDGSMGDDNAGGGPRIDGGEFWDPREEEEGVDLWNGKLDS